MSNLSVPEHAGAWAGRDLGTRRVAWTERDAILFALAVGVPADRLDLVFEDRLRVLPTFALTLAQWAPDALGAGGAFAVGTALHGAQRLDVLGPLPPRGELDLSARVAAVWDKGSAAVFDVEVSSKMFRATWSIFAPGAGGFGGERGPARPAGPDTPATWSRDLSVAPNAAALYRLLGDRHHIHIDPAAAAGIGQPRPILHGLATLAAAAVVLADRAHAHPADLVRLEGRFSSVVFPGETAGVDAWDDGRFRVRTERGVAIEGGTAEFEEEHA
ncbi:MaoC/PaaZ C-terminal domain-containing protein [Streptomyces sp. NPDC057580]|uniref:MaoC/PaaZ C-terminal domain-containing protein n=1 Tax=Streptomyces sp. NPDC057580 TaxID=3346173 RepID=UPI0036C6B059